MLLDFWELQNKKHRQIVRAFKYLKLNENQSYDFWHKNMVEFYVELIIRVFSSYYNTGKAILTDLEYDKLEDCLRLISQNHPILDKVGVITLL